MGNNVYIYKEEDISDEALYQKKQMMSFIGKLGYFRGGTQWIKSTKTLVVPR